MNPLTTGELLGVWENYIQHTPLERSLYLLSAACNMDVNEVARLSIGERDTRLLKLREWLFGSRLINIATCPNCEGQTEWEMATTAISLQDAVSDTTVKILKLDKDGYAIDYRLPNSYDVLKVIADPVINGNMKNFIGGCILNVSHQKKELQGHEIPQNIIDELNRQMADADPQADIRMTVTCPECDHQWAAPFDIVSYLWAEIDNWAKRIIREVAVLARAFGWTENEILRLSPQRRQLYLELATR